MEPSWVVAEPPDPARVAAIMKDLALPPSVARLLYRRGIPDGAAAARFLNPDLGDLGDPFQLAGVPEAVERVSRAIESGERILVHGDYDVDGTTATALLTRVLRRMGAEVDPLIPHRLRDGYGLSVRAIEIAAASKASLVVTADCGIGAVEPVARARELGIDVIVTDHHEVGVRVPDAVAIVNPKRRDCTYPFRDFAGVGVAFKVLEALIARRGGHERALLEEHLDLVALGTIADVVPLRGENRVLAARGLALLADPAKPGLRALVERCGLLSRPIDAGHVAFVLAPRINAAGRLGDSLSSIELLLSEDPGDSDRLVEQLERNNLDRRRLDETILEEAVTMIDGDATADGGQPIVLWSDAWHSGVLGIVASKLVERFRVPAILIALDGEVGRGSGRSVPGFDLVTALGSCDDLLDEWGGHKYAIGLKVARSRLDELRERLAVASRPALARLDRRPALEVDEILALRDCTRDLALACERLAPFGYENGEPIFVCEALQLMEAPRRLGEQGQHLRMTAYHEGHTRECIGFGMGDYADEIGRPGQRFSLAHVPTINRWRGRETVQLKVKAICRD